MGRYWVPARGEKKNWVPAKEHSWFHRGEKRGSTRGRNWVPPREDTGFRQDTKLGSTKDQGKILGSIKRKNDTHHINSDGPIHCRIILIDQPHFQREEELRKMKSNELRKQNISEEAFLT